MKDALFLDVMLLVLVRSGVSEEYIPYIIRAERISELGKRQQ
jgi:hypothetical protein